MFAKRESSGILESYMVTGITQMTLQGVKKQRNLKGTHVERHFAYPDTFNVSENHFDGVVPHLIWASGTVHDPRFTV